MECSVNTRLEHSTMIVYERGIHEKANSHISVVSSWLNLAVLSLFKQYVDVKLVVEKF